MSRADDLEEERGFLLQSLRDLEAEHAAGDIDAVDYQSLKDDYTARAAEVLRRLDVATATPDEPGDPVEPAGADEAPATSEAGVDEVARRSPRARRRRRIVVGVAVIAAVGGIVAAIHAATSSRAPGETLSGLQVGQNAIDQLLNNADEATSKGDALSALKDYEQILSSDPSQVEALTGKGWILAQTGEAALVSQGVDALSQAEQVDPTYTPAHVYRGVALLSEGDDAAAIPELEYYLAHDPDPTLKPRVQQALAQAQAAVAKRASASSSTTRPASTTPTTAG